MKFELKNIFMEILFNKIFLEHNPETEGEGAYRVKDFCDLPDTPGIEGGKYFNVEILLK